MAWRLLWTAVAALCLAACQQRAAEIAWFEGELPAAFEVAARDDKPVLLYWGAAWCPSCAQIKATVMSQPGFIAKSALFVPVYLDGDEPGAQKWAETFGITGYPSVVILNPDRSEILRIAGSMDLSLYAGMLDAALEDRRPLREVLARAAGAAGPEPSAEECQRLAWHGWALEEPAPAAAAQLSRDLRAAALRCPATPAAVPDRLRLAAALLASWAAQGGDGSGSLVEGLPDVAGVMAEGDRAAAQLDLLREMAPEFFEVLGAAGHPAAVTVLRDYVHALSRATADGRFARADQIGAHYSQIVSLKAMGRDDDIAQDARASARARLEAELARVGDDTPLVRAGIISGVVETFQALGDHARAFDIAQRELAVSSTPYYFMGQMATSAEALGRPDALQWYAQAHATSRGAATRFQWGSNQLLAVLRIAPGDTARVREAGLALVAELESPDALYRRSRSRLAKVDAALRDWQEGAPARAAVVVELHQRLRQACQRWQADEDARQDCAGFLAG
ncbi:MAG: hypothetical protein RL026_2421 [Pseudomonadota bacterium]